MHSRKFLFFGMWCGLLMLPSVDTWADNPSVSHAEKGLKAQSQGKTTEAIQWYTRALRLPHRLPRLTLAAVHGGRCQLLFAQSAQHQSPRLLNRALHDCDQALLLKSNHAPWYIIRGRARAIRGEWDQAAEEISMAILLRPEDAFLHLDRARIYKNFNQIKESLLDYDTFLQHQPDHHTGLLERGSLLLINQDPQRALKDFSHAKTLHPKHGETLRLRAEALIALERLPEAMTELDLSITADPNNPESRLQRGSLRASQRLYQLAAEDFRNAVAMAPDNPAMQANLGLIHFLQGHFQEAEQVFQQAVQLQPDDPHALLWRYVASRRANKQEPLPSPPSSLNQAWPWPLFALLQEQLTPEETWNAANNQPDPKIKPAATAEALFFIAQYHLMRDNHPDARIWLGRILSAPKNDEVVTRLIAEEEMKRLDTTQAMTRSNTTKTSGKKPPH
ncbi:MAG: tetratricopeptide repeat protein [Magnetococcus sp. YQC-5]